MTLNVKNFERALCPVCFHYFLKADRLRKGRRLHRGVVARNRVTCSRRCSRIYVYKKMGERLKMRKSSSVIVKTATAEKKTFGIPTFKKGEIIKNA